MIIQDDKLRKTFSAPGNCEWHKCRRWQQVRHCSHLYSKGTGQLDIRINLAGLCWRCHLEGNHRHGGHPDFEELRQLIADREGCDPEWITDEIYRLRRLSKETTREDAGYGNSQAVSRHLVGRGDDLRSDPLETGQYCCADRVEADDPVRKDLRRHRR